jgi:hypothetical protein
MALDVYVGSLTRYCMGDWEGVGETATREGPRSRIGRGQDPDRVQESVLAWRASLVASLAGTVDLELDWDESPDADYYTGRPGWDGFGSLVLWAAYTEHPGLRRPDTLPEEWDDDAALRRCNARGFRSRYSHLVRNVELWLPASFEITFEGEDVDGRRIVMGSAETLARQLADLNGATWKVKADEVAAWAGPSPRDAALEAQARYAFAVLNDLAAKAVGHGLPIKLDF